MATRLMQVQTTIIPVAGGKGGVGKTFVAANLAAALAKRGCPTIIADLDFGNSNLYSFLGVENRYPGIAEFLIEPPTRGSLADLVVPTAVPNLTFIPGDAWTPFTANITHNQKRVLLRELKKLETRYLLLDLGAGTSYNTLDLFRVSERGILVTRPEQPAVISLLVFLKNFVLRCIENELRKAPAAVEALNQLRHHPVSGPAMTVRGFQERLAATHPDLSVTVDTLCERIRPRLIYNMTDDVEDNSFFARIEATARDTLSLNCDHIGFIPYDASVSRSLKRSCILPLNGLEPRTIAAFDRIANRIVCYWNQSIDGSADLLAKHVLRELTPLRHPV